MRRGKRAQAEVTIGPDYVPQSTCQKCRQGGRITSCERRGDWEEYIFYCQTCRRHWAVAL